MLPIEALCARARAWTGRYPHSAGSFEIRPWRLPRDVLPVYDEELDCIVGYQRAFARRCQLHDLNGDVSEVWACTTFLPEPDLRDRLLVVGGLWTARVRGMTPLGVAGCGAAVTPTAVGALRRRFMALAQSPLFYAESAHARMQERASFVPVHILRLALRHGDRLATPPELGAVSRYSAIMWLRRTPHVLDVLMSADGSTVLRFDYWHYTGHAFVPGDGSSGSHGWDGWDGSDGSAGAD